MSFFAVENLGVRFGGVRAVDDVSFTAERGEFLAMIGPNGAGKSTCFNMINGQLPPDSGEILLDGQNIAGLAPRNISPETGGNWPLIMLYHGDHVSPLSTEIVGP